MKWRSYLRTVLVFGVICIAGLSSAKAQSADTYTYDYFYNETTPLFDNTISGITSLCDGKTDANYTSLCSKLKPLLDSTKSSYASTFSSQRGGLTPAKTQLAALQAASNTFLNGRPTADLQKVPAINAAIKTFEAQLNNQFMSEASSVDRDGTNTSGAVPNASAPQKAADGAKSILEGSNCGFTNIPACLMSGIQFFSKYILLLIGGFFLWVASELLNFVINVGILHFSDWATTSLYPLWQVIRQIVSMFVVFAGVYLAFMYIINKGDQFKRYIPWIVIFGLFVNFSYPATRAVIDLSNIISLDIYASAVGTTDVMNENSTKTAGTIIMQSLGLQKLVGETTSISGADLAGDTNSFVGVWLLFAYEIYAAYIFFMACMILIARTIALVFIIIASPILFVDSVIPKLGDQAMKLRKIFFEQISVSVVFMIMLYLSIAVTGVFSKLPVPTSAIIKYGVNPAEVFKIIIMLVLLHITLKVTKQVSGTIGQASSEWVGKFGGFATGAAIGAATGGTGWLARQTVGAAAARWAQSDTLKNAQGSWVGRRAMDLSNSLANSSFDARNSKMAMSVAGTMGGANFAKGFDRSGRLEGYEKAKAARQEKFEKDKLTRLDMMTDETKKHEYLNNNALPWRDNDAVKQKFTEAEQEKTKKQTADIANYTGADTKARIDMAAKAKNNPALLKQMQVIDAFDNLEPNQVLERVDTLEQLGDIDQAKNVIENAKFKTLEEAQKKEIEAMEEELSMMRNSTQEEKQAYDTKRIAIAQKKKDNKEKIEGLKKQMLDTLNARMPKAPKVDVEAEAGPTKLDLDLSKEVQKEDFTDLIKKIKAKNSIPSPVQTSVAA